MQTNLDESEDKQRLYAASQTEEADEILHPPPSSLSEARWTAANTNRNLDASREQDKTRNIGLVCIRRVGPRVRLLQSDC
nr:unnamed protein product [Spirometra erinaceieuropaei]